LALLLAQMPTEVFLDAPAVRSGGFPMKVSTRGGEFDDHSSSIAGIGHPLDEIPRSEFADQTGDTTEGQDHPLHQVTHSHLMARSRDQGGKHVEPAEGNAHLTPHLSL
jgi:hypothetical protein